MVMLYLVLVIKKRMFWKKRTFSGFILNQSEEHNLKPAPICKSGFGANLYKYKGSGNFGIITIHLRHGF